MCLTNSDAHVDSTDRHAGATNSNPVPPTATRVPPTATPIPPTATPVPTLKEIANKVSDNMGKVMQIVDGDPKRVIFFFEERHDSILGQMEIALMLHRLYKNTDSSTSAWKDNRSKRVR